MSNSNLNAYGTNPSNLPYPFTNTSRGLPANASSQGSSTSQTYNTSTKLNTTPGLLGPGRKAWDSQADTLALAAHRKGKIPGDISRDLIKNGYKASTSDVATNLTRLGVTHVHSAARPRLWDTQADSVTMAGHLSGKTVTQIADQLNSTGYRINKVEVGVSLNRQGVRKVEWKAGVPSPLSWDSMADAVALAGHRAGKAVSEIATRLCEQGYNVSSAEVSASLLRQGQKCA